MILYLVVAYGGGAHEPESVMSVWDTELAARAEVERLTVLDSRWSLKFFITPCRLNHPNEEPLT